MYKTVLFLTALALVQARPNEDAEVTNAPYEVHEDCPPAEVHFLIPHEYDCTKFYYCEYGFRFTEAINCAPGTEFNAEKQVCTHSWASNCTLPGFPTTSAPEVTPAPEVTAAPEVTPAPEATPESEETPAPEINAQPVAVLGPPVPFSSPNADDCETLDNGCPVDFTIHKVIPHEEYCHLFYFCDKGERVLWACPEPLYFDPEAQVCVWSWQTDCVNTGPYTYPTAAAPEIETTSTTAPGDFDLGDVLDNGCPANIHIHHLLPHEECEKFYQCNFGEKVERDCAPGTVFHFEIQVCDWPRNVRGCEGSPGATARPPTTPEVTTPNDPEDWVALPNGCPADSSIHHLLPHESECDRYYVCDNGRLVEMGCPTATHFSPSLQQCTWPHEAGCEHWTGGCGSTPDDNGGGCGGSSTAADAISTTPSNVTSDDAITTTEAAPCTGCPTADPGTTPAGLPESSEEITLPSDPEVPGESTNGTTTAEPPSDTEDPIIDPVSTPAPDSGNGTTLATDPELPGETTNATTTETVPCTGCPTVDPISTPAPDSGYETTLPTDPELPGESTNGTTTTEEPPCDTEGPTVDPVSTPTPDSGNETTLPTDPELPGESTNGTTTTEEPPCDTEGPTVDPVSTPTPDSGNETTLPTDPELPGESTNGTTTEEPPCDTEGPGESTDATTAVPGCPQCPPLPINPEDRCKQGCNVAPWAHPECDKYYSCIGNEFQLNICSEGLHFNPSTLTCDFICNAGCIRNIPQVTRHPDGLLMFVPNSFNNKVNMMELIEHELNEDL